MFRKVEIWILYLIILLGVVFSVGFGVLVRQELVGKTKAGWASRAALTLVEIPKNLKEMLLDNDLTVLDRFPTSDGFEGTPNAEVSYLLLSRYDGDLEEGVVELIDLTNFEVLHTWNPDIDAFNNLVEKVDEFKYLDRDGPNERQILGHPKLTTDGGLLIGWEAPLRKINSCSDLMFQNTHDIFHHSIETDIDGAIWAPSHAYPQTLPAEIIGRDTIQEGGFFDNAIVKLSPDGTILFEKSVAQIFIDNGLAHLLFSVGDRAFTADPIHLNDIQPTMSDGPFWKMGDVFLSLRHQSMILLYRPSTNKIIWKGTGPFFHQHDVDIINENTISVFNNNSKDFIGGDVVDGHNEIIIYDFKTDTYSTFLSKSMVENDIRTVTEGLSTIRPNGDLFINESNFGRTLYFNNDGSLRWTHTNRAENGKVYAIGWSRILHTEDDLKAIENLLITTGVCDE